MDKDQKQSGLQQNSLSKRPQKYFSRLCGQKQMAFVVLAL